MEDAGADPGATFEQVRRARGLVLLLLVRLDAVTACIEELNNAVSSVDAFRAVTIMMRLRRAWSDAHITILVLEQISGCPETNARKALNQTHRRARAPLALARSIVPRQSNEPSTPNQEAASAGRRRRNDRIARDRP
jgi:hypothetical protein